LGKKISKNSQNRSIK